MTQFDVAIVGAGFTGAVFAIHLSRLAARPLQIALIDPSPEKGRGLAYGTKDPEHRLNGPIGLHMVYPDDPDHLPRWFAINHCLENDPQALCADGQIFMRRMDFGRYVGEQLQAHIEANPTTSKISTMTNSVVDIERNESGYTLSLGSQARLYASLVVVTTSFEKPAVPSVFDAELQGHPAFIADPWNLSRLAAIRPDGRVLVLGMAQTASDVMASLLARGHTGRIRAISRRGLRPVTRPADAPPLTETIITRVNKEVSPFVARHGTIESTTAILRVLRREIRKLENDGGCWTPPFDDLRDSLWQIWPALSVRERARFLRHLRPWYDAYRFRLPPQVEGRLHAAEARGQLSIGAARVVSARSCDGKIVVKTRRGGGVEKEEAFDAIVNCTGPQSNPARCWNPFLRRLVEKGYASPHPLGVGFDVNDIGYARDANGAADPSLLIVGPLTYGAFADQQGGIFIVARLAKILPGVIGTLLESSP